MVTNNLLKHFIHLKIYIPTETQFKLVTYILLAEQTIAKAWKKQFDSFKEVYQQINGF